MEEILVAQCGLNCNACSSYLAWKNDVRSKGFRSAYCSGCGPRGGCRIKNNCELLVKRAVRFCYECNKFPCKPDDFYRKKFNISPIDNIIYIKKYGIKKFLQKEEKKWECPECGGVISFDKGICYTCGLDNLKKKTEKFKSIEGTQVKKQKKKLKKKP